MPQTLFFAVKDDLIPLFETVEKAGPLKYIRAGRSLSPKYEAFDHGAQLLQLGRATSESAVSCDRFLVCLPELELNIRLVDQSDGIRSYHIDQLENPDTVTFSWGGFWTPDTLLYGRVASASSSHGSKRLMRRFRSAIKAHFAKVGAYHVGPGAFEQLRNGKRLTLAAQSGREFDLTLP